MSDSAQRALEEFMNGDEDQVVNQTEQPKKKTKDCCNPVLDVEEEYNVTTFSAARAQPTSQRPLRTSARGAKTKHFNKSSTNTHKGATSKSSDAPPFADQQAASRGAAVDFAKLHTFYEDELEDEKQNEWETVGAETHQSEDLLSEKRRVELEKSDDDCVPEATVEEIEDEPQACGQRQITSSEVKEEEVGKM